MDLPDLKTDLDESETLRCSVQNCKSIIPEGTGMKIGEKWYCRQCGAQMIKQSLLGMN